MQNLISRFALVQLFTALALMLFVALSVVNVNALERVKIDSNNNLVTEFNTPLRGAPFFLDRFGIADSMEKKLSTYENYFNSVIGTYKLNMVRCAPWIGNHTYYKFDGDQQDHQDRFDIMLDNCVQWAENNDIYAIVNYHTKFNTVLNAGYVKGFWDRYAPRYKNKKHVIYELVNEPEIESVKREMQGIYNHVRALAPNTHMILWSVYDPDKISANEIKNATPNINYQTDNVSVGWHNYWDVNNPTAWNKADSYAAAGLPVINTEFWSLSSQNNLPISYGSIADNVRFAENRGRSWTLWAPYLNYESSSQGYSHDQLKFTNEFINAVKNGAYTIAGEGYEDNVYATGLDGQYWTKWGGSIGYNGAAGTITNPAPGGESSNGGSSNSVSFNSAPSSVDLSGNFTVTAGYSAAGNRDLVLEVFNQQSGAWLGQKIVQVSAGSGSRNITASVGNISAGSYRLKLGIRNRGADWRNSYQDIYRDNVSASGNNSSANNSVSTKPTIRLNASNANQVSSGVQRYDGWGVGNFGPGSWVKFSQVDLGVNGYDEVRARIGANGSGQIEVRAQRVGGPLLATINFSGNDFSNLIWRSSSFPAWEYPQEIYFVMKSGWANLGGVEFIDR